MNTYSTCHTCGNRYAHCFEIVKGNHSYFFDCFECAIHMLAPLCMHCNCKIIGHGIEAGDQFYCCAHCAKKCGVHEAKDHVHQYDSI